MAGLLCYFPKDMVVEIMSWLPADSLIRFKCVAKSWHALISELIDDPAFVAKHLSNTKTRPSTSLVFSHCCPHLDHKGTDCRGDIFSLITILNADRGSGHIPSITEELDLPPPRHEVFDRLGRWQSAYHCDGIVCLIQDPQTIVMCNPTLHESRIIPESGSTNCQGMGFGYDSMIKDYKLVRIFLDESDRAEVYTLGTDTWKAIKMPKSVNIAEILYQEALYWRGVCYWLVNDMCGHVVILCFNMCDEEFHIMKLPELDNTNLVMEEAELTVWNDSIALFVCYSDYELGDFPLFLEIFVFDGYSGEDKGASWTKQLFAGPLEDIANTFSFLHNDEFLMQDIDKHLVAYNVHTQKLRDVIVQDVDRLRHWVCFYMKSLVSVRKR